MPSVDTKRIAAKNRYIVVVPESWEALFGDAKELLVELSAAAETQVTVPY